MPLLTHIFGRDICKKISNFHIFSYFLLFSITICHNHIGYIDFTRIAASNTVTDDVKNWVTYSI